MSRRATARLFVAADPPAPVREQLAGWARAAAAATPSAESAAAAPAGSREPAPDAVLPGQPPGRGDRGDRLGAGRVRRATWASCRWEPRCGCRRRARARWRSRSTTRRESWPACTRRSPPRSARRPAGSPSAGASGRTSRSRAHAGAARRSRQGPRRAPAGSLPATPQLRFNAESLTLYRSWLSPAGARYEAAGDVRAVALGAVSPRVAQESSSASQTEDPVFAREQRRRGLLRSPVQRIRRRSRSRRTPERRSCLPRSRLRSPPESSLDSRAADERRAGARERRGSSRLRRPASIRRRRRRSRRPPGRARCRLRRPLRSAPEPPALTAQRSFWPLLESTGVEPLLHAGSDSSAQEKEPPPSLTGALPSSQSAGVERARPGLPPSSWPPWSCACPSWSAWSGGPWPWSGMTLALAGRRRCAPGLGACARAALEASGERGRAGRRFAPGPSPAATARAAARRRRHRQRQCEHRGEASAETLTVKEISRGRAGAGLRCRRHASSERAQPER